jgi:hypothetical protein
MLAVEVFQSYYSVVSPNESKPEREQSSDSVKGSIEYLEALNYQNFMKAYMKQFANSQPYIQNQK